MCCVIRCCSRLASYLKLKISKGVFFLSCHLLTSLKTLVDKKSFERSSCGTVNSSFPRHCAIKTDDVRAVWMKTESRRDFCPSVHVQFLVRRDIDRTGEFINL